MGCIKSKHYIFKEECFLGETYIVQRPRSNSLDLDVLNASVKLNDRKLYQSKKLSTSLQQMEADILSSMNGRMPRYSTAAHISMSGDDIGAFADYTQFKMDLISSFRPVKLRNMSGIPEAISGQTTPDGFPGYSYMEEERKQAFATISRGKKMRKEPKHEVDVRYEQLMLREKIIQAQVRIRYLPEEHEMPSVEKSNRMRC